MSRPAIHVNVGTSWGPIKKIFRADPLQEHKSAHGEHQPTVVKIDGWDTAAGFHFIMSFFLENSVHIFLVLARVSTTSWWGEYAMWLPPKDPRPSTHGRFTIASPAGAHKQIRLKAPKLPRHCLHAGVSGLISAIFYALRSVVYLSCLLACLQ